VYPVELFDWLASLIPRRDSDRVAWDTATGSGQAAIGLATHFDRVIATDTSAAQIENAVKHPRIEYRVARAEASGLAANSVDLVVAASALHWFDLPQFYEEVRRVARGGAALVAWTYHVGYVEPPFDDVFGSFYHDVVAPYFAPGARLVDDRYEDITLPGQPLEAPPFVASMRWTLPEIVDFVRTWSGVHAYVEAKGEDPVAALIPKLKAICGDTEARVELRWPIYLRASRLH